MKRFKKKNALPVNFPARAELEQGAHSVKPPVKRIESRDDKSAGSIPFIGFFAFLILECNSPLSVPLILCFYCVTICT